MSKQIGDNRLQELRQLKYDITVDLYRQRAYILAAHSKGLEAFFYKAFGYFNMGSLALLIDPYWQFSKRPNGKGTDSAMIQSIYPIKVVPVNRTRYFTAIYPFTPKYHEQGKVVSGHDYWTWNGTSYDYHPLDPSTVTTNYVANIAIPQLVVNGYIKDTTWKSRNPGVKVTRRSPKAGLQSQGEFEKFHPYLRATGPTYGGSLVDQVGHTDHSGNGTAWDTAILRSTFSGYWDTPCCTVSSAGISSFSANEKVYATSVMVKNLDSMLARCVPTRRYYNLAYQISELRDVPKSIKYALKSFRDIEYYLGRDDFHKAVIYSKWWTPARARKLSPLLEKVGIERPLDKTLAELYLNFKFGWESMRQAVLQLAERPAHVTKEVNYLIGRNGRFTNLSTERRWAENVVTAIPSFSVPETTHFWGYNDGFKPVPVDARREIRLRCMCNVGVNFPRVNLPRLRQELFQRKLGLFPYPGDLYDMIPWTWMVDWFNGLGDYLHLMDAINSDSSLINYGFMTFKSKVTCTAKWSLEHDENTLIFFTGLYSHGATNKYYLNPRAQLVMEYELRKDISSLTNVKTYSGSHLTGYQSSILGALFSKFI